MSTAPPAGKAGDATFTSNNVPGVKVTAVNNIVNWNTPVFGDTPNDLVIAKVASSIRYGLTWKVELSGLIPDSIYKVQLIFYEQCCAGRGFNVTVDGVLLAEAFIPADIQGGVNNTAAGAVIAAEFNTFTDKVVIIGDGPAGRAVNPDLINDTNATLDGVTLEVIKAGTPRPTIKISKANGNLLLTFEGKLQSSDTASGGYTDVAGAATLSVTPSSKMKFYRAVR